MSNVRRRARPRRSRPGSRQTELGGLLADLRAAKRLSLRQVEEATDQTVSNAYLSQLEKGKIQRPSPHVFSRLAAVYAVPYEMLMEKAGYLPRSEGSSARPNRLHAFAIDDLTTEEEEQLLKYLAFIRTRSPAR